MIKTRQTIPNYTMRNTTNPNIKRFVDMDGEWTHYWLKKEKKFVPSITHVLGVAFPKDDRFMEYLLGTTKDDARRKLKTAGEEGTRCHEAVRMLVDSLTVSMGTRLYSEISGKIEGFNADEWWNIESWVNWQKKYQPEVIAQETTVYDADSETAGTFDFLGTVLVPQKDKNFPEGVWGKRIPIMIDWKFSSGIWPNYKLQVSAYRNALKFATPKLKKTLEGVMAELEQPVWTMIVRCGTKHKEGFEVEVYAPFGSQANYVLFRNTKATYDDLRGEFEPVIRDIQSQFKVNIPKLKLKTKSNEKTKRNKRGTKNTNSGGSKNTDKDRGGSVGTVGGEVLPKATEEHSGERNQA